MLSRSKIELDAPDVGVIEKKYVNEAIDNGYVSTFGPYVAAFEEKFANYLGTMDAVATQSGTASLHIALHELGIGKGDEVIIPALTFVATANAVVYEGAQPVFADVEERTWNIDPESIERNITARTKAIIPVHLYGNPCSMEAITRIAEARGLYVVEDATESLGARYKDRPTGTLGDFGCFSFNGNKIITTGGGGMIIGHDPERLAHIKFLVNQARDEEKGYYHPEIGFNYRMTNLEASLGLAQMERLDAFLGKKRKFNQIYREELGGIERIRFQEECKDAESSRWLTCVAFEGEKDLTGLQKALREQCVPTRRLFMPITEFPPYKLHKKTALTNTYRLYEESLCLPGSMLNDEDAIHYVCGAIKDLVR